MENIKETRELLYNLINESTGIKATELMSIFVAKCYEKKYPIVTIEIIQGWLDDMVNNGEIVELDYTLERMDYRIKTIYFPKGTSLYPIGGVSTNNPPCEDSEEKEE